MYAKSQICVILAVNVLMNENCEKRFVERDNLEEILEGGNYEKAKVTEEIRKIHCEQS